MARNPDLSYVTVGIPIALLKQIEMESLKQHRTRVQQIVFILEGWDQQAGAVIERGFVKSVKSELVESPSESQSEAQAKPEDHKNERKRHHHRK